jgi:ABC-type branched-subunit amino acid transport system substrate-binding protein
MKKISNGLLTVSLLTVFTQVCIADTNKATETAVSERQQGINTALDQAINNLGGNKRIAIVYDTSSGASGHKTLVNNLKQYPNVKVVATEAVNSSDADLSSVVFRIKSSGASTIFLVGSDTQSNALSNAMSQFGMNIPIVNLSQGM